MMKTRDGFEIKKGRVYYVFQNGRTFEFDKMRCIGVENKAAHNQFFRRCFFHPLKFSKIPKFFGRIGVGSNYSSRLIVKSFEKAKQLSTRKAERQIQHLKKGLIKTERDLAKIKTLTKQEMDRKS